MIQVQQTCSRELCHYSAAAAGSKRAFEDDGISGQQRLKIASLMSSPRPMSPQIATSGPSPVPTDPTSFEFWPAHRVRPASSAASSGCRSGEGPSTSPPPPSNYLAYVRRASEISFDVHPNVHISAYREAPTNDLDLHIESSSALRKWSPCQLVPMGRPVLPQPAPDPDSNVFKPEPMLHLNGQAMQHLTLLGEMRTKVAQAFRRRITRRVAAEALSQKAADTLLRACMSRLAKPVSIALQRYCAAKRFFAEGQSCLSRMLLSEGRGALGLFSKDVTVVTATLANSVVKAAVRAETEAHQRPSSAPIWVPAAAAATLEVMGEASWVAAASSEAAAACEGAPMIRTFSFSGMNDECVLAPAGMSKAPSATWPSSFLSLLPAAGSAVAIGPLASASGPDSEEAPQASFAFEPSASYCGRTAGAPASSMVVSRSSTMLPLESSADSPEASEEAEAEEEEDQQALAGEEGHGDAILQLLEPALFEDEPVLASFVGCANGGAVAADPSPAAGSDELDLALSGVFMSGLNSIDWFAAVQEAYGFDPEELLEQQATLPVGDDDEVGGGGAGPDVEQLALDDAEVVASRRPSIWH